MTQLIVSVDNPIVSVKKTVDSCTSCASDLYSNKKDPII